MAIVKSRSSLRPLRDGGDDSSPDSREIVSVDDSSGDLSTSSDDSDDSDSGMGSDSLDLSGLGEPSTELYQIGRHTVSLPLELNDLQDLSPMLNLETWNNCLSEEERFALSEFLPDMDQETFTQTLKELFSGKNFHFGSPLSNLLTKLKGGALDPRIVLYSRGLICFKKHMYYHLLREYQNSMVGSLERIHDAWQDCSGYGIEERLRILNILRSRRSLGYEREAGGVWSETDSESGNSAKELWSRSVKMDHQAMRFVKDDAKGILKVTPPKVSAKKDYTLFAKPAAGKKSKALKGLPSFPQHPMRASDGCNGAAVGNNDVDDEEMEEHRYEMGTGAMLLKHRKEESHVEMLPYDRKVRTIDQGVTIASFNPHSLETMSKARYSGKDWMYPPKGRSQHQWSVGSQPIKSEELNVRGKKLTGENDSKTGLSKTGFDPKARSYKALPALVGDPYMYSANRAEVSREKIKSKYPHDGRLGIGFPRDSTAQSEETESDSSEQVEKDGEAYSFAKKAGYPIGVMEGQHPGLVKSTFDVKKSSKHAKVDKQLHSSILTPEFKPYYIKEKKRSKTTDPNYLQDIVFVKKGPVSHPSETVQPPPPKINASDKKRKGTIKLDSLLSMMGDHGSGKMKENEEYLKESSQFLDSPVQVNRAGNRYHITDADHIERSNMPLSMCNSVTKKRKGKADGINQDEMEDAVYLQYSPMQHIDEPNFIKKKGKRKADASSSPLLVAAPDTITPEKETADVEPETKPHKKPFTLITPTKHTGFSFSIIHLLSAVRKAMLTPHMEDAAGIGNHLEKGDVRLKQKSEEEMLPAANGTQLLNMDMIASQEAGQNNLPCLSVQEIVNRVRTNPGDPCILETQEPLQDLVRGVLKIFSSKTAPLGAKGWKVLLSYEKSNKSWCWVGPVSSSSSDNYTVEEETSSEAWGIPHKMLVKLVDAFANWLHSGQETLRQIGSLPAPPIVMLPELDEKERFRDLRAQKSLSTISPSTEEVRAYFRKEELLRYLIPDRAFSYTAADGKKSIVASLRRGGGKPTSKARDHFMLKPDRPPHVTILCLVRDAAARLPGSIGTRADVCTLIRDSQYIVEDVTDAQVNQVVSGALDRLHYERDPCVQFDSDRKLWVYLHRDREEEDFEDDGTSSTKKWKRQRKDATDQSDTGAANDVTYHASGDPTVSGSARYDFNPDHNVDSSSFQAGINEHMYNDLRSNMDNFQPLIVDPSAGDRGEGNPMGWEALGLNALQENKLLCQENSTNEEFEDEAFSRERPVGILSATLL
ncbi:uncharacterized protein M6B38_340295 [Iris pallida]|uniref:DEUBAD domain-containing protein n=1 Tax=Iris pallida TaxID=29817 RepID=A0AAX6GYF2_IRIPA|nr:uncharacterized protein M6B38_340295 [Iris pallida]